MTTLSVPRPDVPPLRIPPRLLLGPGPSLVEPRVLQAMGAPLLGHLDPQFIEIMDRTQSMLRYVFQTANPLTLPVSGTGTAAMEAAVANLVEPGDPVLICAAGYFGLRIADMARRYGGEVEVITRSWGQVFSPEEVSAALDRRPARVVAIVHAETSTGVCQPLEEIARIVHAQGGLLIVDAVTSLGGVPLRVDEWDLDVCYSGAQKCLGCPPGISPITFNARAAAKLEARKTPVTNFYLDMSILGKYWGKERMYHHTAPISMVYALHEGLQIVLDEGLEARWQRHRANAEMLWAGLQAQGWKLHVDLEYRLPPLTTVVVPSGVDDVLLRQRLLKEYNIEISGGLGELKGKVLRIGLMGYSSRPENVLTLLAALDKIR